MPEEDRFGRRASDADTAVLIERLDTFEKDTRITLGRIEGKVDKTNGRVSELEVKDRIRTDREEREANRLAAEEAAKFRVEEHLQEVGTQRATWRVMLLAAAVGSAPGGIIEFTRLLTTGHL